MIKTETKEKGQQYLVQVHQTEFDLKQSGGLKPCYIPTDMKLTDGF
jgi:hypothetical protein